MAKRKEAEATVTVALRPSVARDVITVLRKFSEQRMEKLLVGDHDTADRLLALNLFRHDLEETLNENRTIKRAGAQGAR